MGQDVVGQKFHEHVQAIIDETGIADPREAIRIKARMKLAEFSALFTSPPYDLVALASCVGLQWSDDSPAFSEDSEIVPTREGRVMLRVNQERPVTRQRFSIAHEIGHTLFPEYQFSVKCRKATERRWTEDDLLESLCDVAASEFMFPLPWFPEQLKSIEFTGPNLAILADNCIASREAMVRRIVELSETPMAAIFFSWKLKPVEKKAVRRRQQQASMFPDFEPPPPTPMLRVDYSILNDRFRSEIAIHIPEHKSIPSSGVIYDVSISKNPGQANQDLDLGALKGKFKVVVLPVYSDQSVLTEKLGASVVALVQPIERQF